MLMRWLLTQLVLGFPFSAFGLEVSAVASVEFIRMVLMPLWFPVSMQDDSKVPAHQKNTYISLCEPPDVTELLTIQTPPTAAQLQLMSSAEGCPHPDIVIGCCMYQRRSGFIRK